MPQVYISFHPSDEARLSRLITMPKRRFARIPVVPAKVDEALLSELSAMPEFYVHATEFSSYFHILRSLDVLTQKTSPTVANVSLSPGPLPFHAREPINLAAQVAAGLGHVVVFAAGNDGPPPRTMSPWSVAPWVIGVGAATKTGDALLPESSIGDEADSLYRPVVVAPGETVVPLREEGSSAHGTMVGLVLIGKDYAGRNVPGCKDVSFRGTSVAAPKVARICVIAVEILRLLLAVDLYIRRRLNDNHRANSSAVELIERINADLVGRNAIDDADFLVFRGLSSKALSPLFAFLARHIIEGVYPADFTWPGSELIPFPTSVMKHMLVAMARPMPAHAPHEVGAGFVNEDIATAYLTRLSSRQVLMLVFPTVSQSLLDGWEHADTPLFHADLIDEVKRRIEKDYNLTAMKVV